MVHGRRRRGGASKERNHPNYNIKPTSRHSRNHKQSITSPCTKGLIDVNMNLKTSSPSPLHEHTRGTRASMTKRSLHQSLALPNGDVPSPPCSYVRGLPPTTHVPVTTPNDKTHPRTRRGEGTAKRAVAQATTPPPWPDEATT